MGLKGKLNISKRPEVSQIVEDHPNVMIKGKSKTKYVHKHRLMMKKYICRCLTRKKAWASYKRNQDR